jgi:hypothetical protein
MTKSIEPLGLVVWHDMGQPKSNWVVLMSGITTWLIGLQVVFNVYETNLFDTCIWKVSFRVKCQTFWFNLF